MKLRGIILGSFVLVLGLIINACNDSSSSGSGSIGAAIGGLFASSGESSIHPVENDTCGEFDGEPGSEEGNPSGVSTAATITAGTYGSSSESVTVTADDDCESDAENAFASFTLTEDVEGDCSSGGNVTMKSGSSGIFRNTSDYVPEIYGTFSFVAGGTTYTDVKCTIRMNGSGTIVAAESSCEDSAGGALSLTSSDTCSFGD